MLEMEIGQVYTRKDVEYRVVGKIPNESEGKEGQFVYTVAERKHGSDVIDYTIHHNSFSDKSYTRESDY